MCNIMCKNCEEFKKNGCVDSLSVIYGTIPIEMGNCLITNRLRNALNGCDLTVDEMQKRTSKVDR